LSVEAQKTMDEDPVFHTGAEVWVGSMEKCIAFRAGYQSNKLTKNLGDMVGTAFGTGIRFQALQFDYAFVPFGLLGDAQRFSVSYRFGGKPSALDEAPSKVMNVEVKPQLADIKTGSVKTATFDLRPEARTDIKNWALDITDSKGNVLKSYSGKGVPPRSLTWDGKDEQGNVVTGGLFSTYNMRTIDKRGQQVIASDAIFKVQSADVALRSVDQRVLALHPEALASLGIAPSTEGSAFSQPPVIPQTLQPVGDLGVIKVPSISFGTRTSNLRPGFSRYLDQVAALIRKYPAAKVYIEGHAYDEGPEAENVALSQRRADTVLRYLVEVGKVAPDHLYSRGHGSSAPMDVGKSEASRSRNRRVDIVVLTK
jgi:outer membrane protein OmpA-like peptidoglycan-associated protein